MLGARQGHTRPAHTQVSTKAPRVLIVQPNEDVRELLAEHCRRMGLEPVLGLRAGAAGGDRSVFPSDVDAIVADPASPAGRRLLAERDLEQRTTPMVFASVYPPAGRLTCSPAVAYLVLPCSWERFELALDTALTARR